jgi:hypothetical protein
MRKSRNFGWHSKNIQGGSNMTGTVVNSYTSKILGYIT